MSELESLSVKQTFADSQSIQNVREEEEKEEEQHFFRFFPKKEESEREFLKKAKKILCFERRIPLLLEKILFIGEKKMFCLFLFFSLMH